MCLYLHWKKKVVENFSFDSIIDEFKDLKEWRKIFCICVISFVGTVILNYLLIFTFIFIVLVIIIKYINFELLSILFWLIQNLWSRSAIDNKRSTWHLATQIK